MTNPTTNVKTSGLALAKAVYQLGVATIAFYSALGELAIELGQAARVYYNEHKNAQVVVYVKQAVEPVTTPATEFVEVAKEQIEEKATKATQFLSATKENVTSQITRFTIKFTEVKQQFIKEVATRKDEIVATFTTTAE